ncbi:MAG: DUF6445 family protein, partial [bacterium]|nr:DUF6445 family protein [bacterium]
VEVRRVGTERHTVLRIDGLLTGAEALVDFAAERAVLAPVKTAANFYPGVRAPTPRGYGQALITALRPHLAARFDIPIDARADVTSALSMANLPADQASVAQRLPHIDTTDPNQLAILHYLCGPEHGGTAFYRHRSTGLEAIDPRHGKTYFAALRQEIATASIPAGYITGSNALFEQTALIEPAFNRVVVYASRILHAGALPTRPLSSNPRAGRLTANTFFRFHP